MEKFFAPFTLFEHVIFLVGIWIALFVVAVICVFIRIPFNNYPYNWPESIVFDENGKWKPRGMRNLLLLVLSLYLLFLVVDYFGETYKLDFWPFRR